MTKNGNILIILLLSVVASHAQPDSVKATITKPTCVGYNDGAVDITVYGGTSPYSYYWSNARTTEDISGLGKGTCHLTVTDAASAKYYKSFPVLDPEPAINAGGDTTLCLGDSITLMASGGTSYYWSGGYSQGGTVAPTISTTYYLTATDSAGCTSTIEKNVRVSVTDYSLSQNPSIVRPRDTVELRINSWGNDFVWSNGATSASFVIIPDTSYTYNVSITNTDGCQVVDSISIMLVPYASFFGDYQTNWQVLRGWPDGMSTDSFYVDNKNSLIQSYNNPQLSNNNTRVENNFGHIYEKDDNTKLCVQYDGREYVLCDVSLSVGDSFSLPIFYYNIRFSHYVGITIDSIFYRNDKKTLMSKSVPVSLYPLSIDNGPLYFIEGVGLSCGPLICFYDSLNVYPASYGLIRQKLLCSSKDYMQVYSNIYADNDALWSNRCYYVEQSIEKKNNDHITISPNPFFDEIIINVDAEALLPLMVEIYSADGNLLFMRLLNKHENKLKLDIPKGVYYVHLSKNFIKITHKIIKI